MLRKPQFPNQLEIPGTCFGIQQFRRRSYAILIISHSRKIIAEQIGHEKQLVGYLQLRIIFLLHGIQLKQGIDGHYLRTRFCIVHLYVHFREKLFRHPFRTAVAITHRITQQISLFVYQSEIHTPRINSDTLQRIAFFYCHTDAGLHILKQGKEIPVYMSSHPYLTVRKSVYRIQHKFTLGKVAGNHPATTSSKVNCQICFFHFVFLPKMYVSRSSISSFVKVLYFPPESTIMRQAISKNMARSKA